MSAWLLYLIIKLDETILTLATICIMFALISLVGFVAWWVWTVENKQEKAQKGKKYGWVFLILCLVLLIIGNMIPTTKQAAILLVVPKTLNAIDKNEQLKNIPNKIINLADDWLNELSPKNKNNK